MTVQRFLHQGHPSHPLIEVVPASDFDALAAENARLREALASIKNAVCGEAQPHWVEEYRVTNMRRWIADQCDAALPPSVQPSEEST